MKKLLLAATLLASASIGAMAYAQVKPGDATMPQTEAMLPAEGVNATDARSLASDREVGEARRAYRAACNAHESAGFCECVTAGVAQALMPAEVRIAARTIGDRITAQGDAAMSSESDATTPGASSAERIEQVEGHYADACAQYRG